MDFESDRKTNLLCRVLPGIFWLYASDGKS
jgi:hypothetical protein